MGVYTPPPQKKKTDIDKQKNAIEKTGTIMRDHENQNQTIIFVGSIYLR